MILEVNIKAAVKYSIVSLTFSYMLVKNGQPYLKDLVVCTP